MSRLSVKQQLIMFFEDRLDIGFGDQEDDVIRMFLRDLRSRGSGPLPLYFELYANERGFEAKL